MSTSASPIVTAAHPQWYSRAGTWFLKIGKAVKHIVAKIENEMPGVQSEIAKIAPTAEAISNILMPGSSNFEQHLLDVWGVVANGVKAAGNAIAANGVNVALDQALVDEIRKFLPQVEAYLHPAASPAPPPKQ